MDYEQVLKLVLFNRFEIFNGKFLCISKKFTEWIESNLIFRLPFSLLVLPHKFEDISSPVHLFGISKLPRIEVVRNLKKDYYIFKLTIVDYWPKILESKIIFTLNSPLSCSANDCFYMGHYVYNFIDDTVCNYRTKSVSDDLKKFGLNISVIKEETKFMKINVHLKDYSKDQVNYF